MRILVLAVISVLGVGSVQAAGNPFLPPEKQEKNVERALPKADPSPPPDALPPEPQGQRPGIRGAVNPNAVPGTPGMPDYGNPPIRFDDPMEFGGHPPGPDAVPEGLSEPETSRKTLGRINDRLYYFTDEDGGEYRVDGGFEDCPGGSCTGQAFTAPPPIGARDDRGFAPPTAPSGLPPMPPEMPPQAPRNRMQPDFVSVPGGR